MVGQSALMYSNGIKDDTNKWSDNWHYYGAGVKYAKGAVKSLVDI